MGGYIMPKLCILLNVRDRATEVAMCLQSLRTSNYQDFDVYILDESSTPLGNYHFMNCITTLLKQENHKVFIKPNKSNGATHARQTMIDWVRSLPFEYEYYLRLDDDCIVQPDYIDQLFEVINEGYDLASGVTVPCQPCPKRDPKFLNGIINRVELDIKGNHKINGDDCGMPYTDKKILPAHHFRSCALYKSKIHEVANYLPTRLSPKGFREEQIFSYRLQLAGYKIGVNTYAINYHQMTPSGGCRYPNSEQLVKQDQEMFEEFTRENKTELKKLFK